MQELYLRKQMWITFYEAHDNLTAYCYDNENTTLLAYKFLWELMKNTSFPRRDAAVKVLLAILMIK